MEKLKFSFCTSVTWKKKTFLGVRILLLLLPLLCQNIVVWTAQQNYGLQERFSSQWTSITVGRIIRPWLFLGWLWWIHMKDWRSNGTSLIHENISRTLWWFQSVLHLLSTSINLLHRMPGIVMSSVLKKRLSK